MPSNVEGPFSNAMDPSRVVWRNCCFLGCVGAFSQLLNSFSKLLARLMVLLQWGDFYFFWFEVHSSAVWAQLCLRKIWDTSCILCLVFSIKHSIGCSICRISSWFRVDRRLNFCCNPSLKKKKITKKKKFFFKQ